METDLPPYGPPQSGFAHQRAGRLHRKDQTVSLDPHLSGECRSEIPIAFPDQCHRLFPAPLINPVVGLLAPAGRTQSSRSLRIQTALQAPNLPGRQPQFPGCRNLAHRPGLQPLKHAVSFQFPFAQANLLLRHVHFLLKRTLLLGTDRTLPLGSNTSRNYALPAASLWSTLTGFPQLLNAKENPWKRICAKLLLNTIAGRRRARFPSVRPRA